MRRLIPIALVALIVTPLAQSSRAQPSHWFELVSLAQLGAVKWRCDGARQSLSFTADPDGATETVRFRTAKRALRPHVVQPGESLRFPLLAPTLQRLELTQATEAGTLRAIVTARFVRSLDYCFAYFPPATSVRLLR